MASIGKISIVNMKKNDIKMEADLRYESIVIGRVSTNIGIDHDVTELSIHPLYRNKIVYEAQLLLNDFGVVFNNRGYTEELIVVLVKTLLMLNDIEETYTEICDISGCEQCLIVTYHKGGATYIPAGKIENLQNIASVLEKDKNVEFSLILDKNCFDIKPEEHLSKDYILMHLCS